MPPKATTTKATAKKTSPPEHPPYKEMVKEAIVALKDRNGSSSTPHYLYNLQSRPALKKYIKANYKGVDTDRFDGLFNAAVKKGQENNEFSFPKGPSGTVKLVKKEPAPKAVVAKKPAVSKAATKTAPKKTPAATKKTAVAKPKAVAATKKTSATKPKANAKKTRKEPVAAPAIVEKPAVLTKTKSGRVSKGTTAAKVPAKKKAAAPKKKTAAPKKAST
ncbi:hypothetical protein EDC01DRAFT_626436 [Geopyxis carbonaria]|nr:hypothetical protein EDC01DRAFT_626436 [Geopyxis carbonaria]